MKYIFTAEQRIGEIAAIFPKATDIFMVYSFNLIFVTNNYDYTHRYLL